MDKKMIINTGTCDVRKVKEETLQAYGQITINAAMILANEQSRALLSKYPVTMSCAQVLDVEGDVRVSTVNGSTQIKSTDVLAEKRYLLVNGSLEIGPNTQKVLEKYVGITVNGSVTYPESMSGALGMMTVNGSTICYPDGAVVLKRNAVIDRLFALRARSGLYWAAKRLIMVDPQLNPAALEAKGARFSSKTAILAESKVEGLIGLIDEKTEIVIVPDGTAVILDDVTLDNGIVKKYGKKLYIVGDLEVNRDSAEALERLEYLNVRGDAAVTGELKDLLMEKVQEIAGDMEVTKGRTMSDKISVRISKWMLEREPEGISVSDCVTVKIDKDVDNGLILERLSISDCASVCCTSEQEAAVTAICEDVAAIQTDDSGSRLFKGVFNERGEYNATGVNNTPDSPNTQVINAAEYVM